MSVGYCAIYLKSSEDKLNNLHLLPCSVDYDGSAKTQSYFVPVRKEDHSYEANFRGRRLCGRKIDFENYTGHVVGSTMALQSEEQNNAFEDKFSELQCAEDLELHTIEGFDDLVVWDHDRLSLDSDDDFISSLSWLDLSTSIHADCSTIIPENNDSTTVSADVHISASNDDVKGE